MTLIKILDVESVSMDSEVKDLVGRTISPLFIDDSGDAKILHGREELWFYKGEFELVDNTDKFIKYNNLTLLDKNDNIITETDEFEVSVDSNGNIKVKLFNAEVN